MQSLIRYTQDHRWNLLIIIHNSLGVSEYGSCIMAHTTALCGPITAPEVWQLPQNFCLIVWCDYNAKVLGHNCAKVVTVYSKVGGRGEPRNLANSAAEFGKIWCGKLWALFITNFDNPDGDLFGCTVILITVCFVCY